MTGSTRSNTEAEATAFPSTGVAPSMPARRGAAADALNDLLAPGRSFDDFDIVRLLGAGAFARVYLARQRSLDRLVALKATTNQSDEARTLANLEHPHIVRVHSEGVYPSHGLRLLVMQYVPGLTLARVIEGLRRRDPATWSGRAILDILDALATDAGTLDPVALEGRAFLQECDFAEAVCWLGARLAEALMHAHGQGVLHRDIKPANILVNPYGRPFLADFNIARPSRAVPGQESIGGTLGYMAPEHLEAFTAREGAAPPRVDERSDLYSLTIVLFELLTGRLPFEGWPRESQLAESLAEMAAERRAAAPSPRTLQQDVPEALDRAARRGLDPDPARRYQTAAELVDALEGCRELRRIERQLPAGGRLAAAVAAQPRLVLPLVIVLPHVLGSAVNITYNALRIVDDLTPAQQGCFALLVLAYNLVVYPVCIGLLVWVAARFVRSWRRLLSEPPGLADASAVRRRALALPAWAVALSCAGWLPGGLFFPLALHVLSDPVTPAEFGHFLVSFTVSGLIALTYSYFAILYVVLRVLYPRLWADAAGLRRQARAELARLPGQLRLYQFLAGLIPLTGALMMITVGPDQLTLTFRLLLTALIALGMIGFGAALLVSQRLLQTVTLFAGTAR